MNQKYWVLIQKFIIGEADEDQHRIIMDWMDEKPANRKLVQDLKDIWELTPREEFDVDVQGAWKEFQHRQGIAKPHNLNKDYRSRKVSKMPLYVLRTAAVILVSMFAGVFMQYTLTQGTDVEQVSEFYVMQTFETGKGEKARVTFSDGTKVILNSASSIQFPKEFPGQKREVYLDGEAYFEVAHNSNHPFIVYAQDVEVQVLGTEFNVQGWSDDASVEVAVRNGKVAVGSSGTHLDEDQQVILTRGLHTIVERGENPSPPKNVNITNHFVWTRGGLHFDNVPFNKVAKRIERRFNVQIDGVRDELKDIPYTGTFLYAELDEVLSVIGASMGIEYQRDGMEITIE
ncbi:MAG: FecR domain-containing protein [Balneolaceae bacterium]